MNERIWERVHSALDERRDPLTDEHVLVELEQDPEAQAQLAALLGSVARLERERPVERAPRRRVMPLAATALAAGLAATLAVWLLLPMRKAESPDAGPVAHATPATPTPPRSRVLAFSISVERDGAQRTETWSDGVALRELRVDLEPLALRTGATLPPTTIVVSNQTRTP